MLENLEDEVAGEQRLEAAAAERQAVVAAAGAGEMVAALVGTAAVAAGQRRGFNEGDQEALYMRTHDLQRVGRRGLGKSEIKVGGVKWEGSKKTFVEEEEEEEHDAVSGQVPAKEGATEAKGDVSGESVQSTKAANRKLKRQDGSGKEEEDAVVAVVKDGEKQQKAKKARRRQQEDVQQQRQVLAAVVAIAGAEEDGQRKKARQRKDANRITAPDTAPIDPSEPLQQHTQQHQLQEEDRPAGVDASAGGTSVGGAATPKPKWLKLARMILKKVRPSPYRVVWECRRYLFHGC